MEPVPRSLGRGECPDLREMAEVLGHWLAGDGVERFPAGELELSWKNHRTHVEGGDGLFAAVRERAPRLSGELTTLEAEHVTLDDAIVGVLEAESLEDRRSKVPALIDLIERHCRRAVTVVYDAYDQEIGGG